MTEPKSLEFILDPKRAATWDEYNAAVEEMARRLRKLAERHKQDIPGLSRFCAGCSDFWPCPDAEIIEGRA